MNRTVRNAVAFVVVQRVTELVWSRRNEARLRRRGGVESGAGHYPAMVAIHASWLVSTALESSRSRRPSRIALAFYVALQPLRYWVISSLGDRWTTRILVVPGERSITSGPFRWVRHPNYAIVAAELLLLPLAVRARRTGIVFSVANALLMAVRIPAEQEALRRAELSDRDPTG